MPLSKSLLKLHHHNAGFHGGHVLHYRIVTSIDINNHEIGLRINGQPNEEIVDVRGGSRLGDDLGRKISIDPEALPVEMTRSVIPGKEIAHPVALDAIHFNNGTVPSMINDEIGRHVLRNTNL